MKHVERTPLADLEQQIGAFYPTTPWILRIAPTHMFLYNAEGSIVCSYEMTHLGVWFCIFDMFPINQLTCKAACIANARRMAGRHGLEVLGA